MSYGQSPEEDRRLLAEALGVNTDQSIAQQLMAAGQPMAGAPPLGAPMMPRAPMAPAPQAPPGPGGLDPMSGEPLAPPPAPPPLSPGAQAEASRLANNALAQKLGAGFPQDTTPAAQAPAAPPAPKPDMSRVVTAPPPQPQGAASMQSGPAGPTLVAGPGRAGGWQNTLAPELRPQLAEAQRNQLEGLEAQGREKGEMTGELAGQASDTRLGYLAKMHADTQSAEAERAALEQHGKELQDRGNAVANLKVEPGHFMHSKSTGERIGLALSMGLGAFGAALTHTENTPAKMVESAINDDIRAQEHNIESQKGGLENAKGILADKWRLFEDKEKGKAAARQEYLNMASLDADAIAKRHAGAIDQGALQQTKGQLQEAFVREGHALNPRVAAQGAAHMLDVPGLGKVSIDEYEKLQKAGVVAPAGLESRKTEAEIGKTEAETKKLEGEAAPDQRLGDLAQRVLQAPNTSLTGGHPINYAASKLGVQGSHGQAANEDLASYNTALELALHKQGVRLGDPKHAEQFIGQWKIETNDTPETRRLKVAAAQRSLGQPGGAPPPAAAMPASFRKAGE